tara:strand:- start:51 stop:260 length:210 start_codon:yes stop_codon:yes gene_type:complete
MAASHFSGPVLSGNGLGAGASVLTAALPAAADSSGQIYMISDDGVGDNEIALVVSNGTAWLKITTTALT